jgi:hypothetical protein
LEIAGATGGDRREQAPLRSQRRSDRATKNRPEVRGGCSRRSDERNQPPSPDPIDNLPFVNHANRLSVSPNRLEDVGRFESSLQVVVSSPHFLEVATELDSSQQRIETRQKPTQKRLHRKLPSTVFPGASSNFAEPSFDLYGSCG